MADAKAKNKAKLPKGRHRDQIKRQKQTQRRTTRNQTIRSEVRTFIKKVREAITKKDTNLASQALASAVVKIDKAVSKGVFHKNNGSRKVSRLSRAIANLPKA